MIKQMFKQKYYLLLGEHPHNTFLSFNYHNVNHINRYLKK